jgi:hypothetical protein
MNITPIKLSSGSSDQERWNSLLKVSDFSNYMASMSYENLRQFDNRSVTTFIFNSDGIDIAGAHYSMKKSFSGLVKTADILSGFVFQKPPRSFAANYIINHFLDWAKKNRADFARITTWLPTMIEDEKIGISDEIDKIIRETGFDEMMAGRSTYWIDLEMDEEKILGKMKRDTKSRIKQAIKAGVRVEIHNHPDDELVDLFWLYYRVLGKDKGFDTLGEIKFKHLVSALLQNNLAAMFVTKYDDHIINISLASSIGIASYLYGAINPSYSTIKGCPPPGHISQWEMIRYMKKIGVKVYDMGFCPGKEPDPAHPRYPIWRFKYGFGGSHVVYQPVYGMELNNHKGRLFKYLKYRKR